jgi:mitofilin
MEQELHLQLSRQAAAHSDHLADVLRIQRKELILQHKEHLREKLVSEHVRIQKELDSWIQRLKGIEAVVEGEVMFLSLMKDIQPTYILTSSCKMNFAEYTHNPIGLNVTSWLWVKWR